MSKVLRLIAVSVFLSLPILSHAQSADTVKIGRYIKTSLEPKQEIINPLEVVINVRLPKRMNLVGESIEYLLSRSGYRIRPSENGSSPEMYVLFSLPIPAQHRQMGLIRLSRALEVLASDAYQMQIDKVRREIWFELANGNKNTLAGIDLEMYKTRWEERQVVQSEIVFDISTEYISEAKPENNNNNSNPATTYGPIEPGETLAIIAEQYLDGNLSRSQIMFSIFENNPEAFINDNINLLRQGVVLVIPNHVRMSEIGVAEALSMEQLHHELYREMIGS